MDKEDKQIIDRATKEEWRIGDRTRLKHLLEKNLKLYRENINLKSVYRLLGERCNQLLKDKGDLTDKIADIKANCDLAIEGRDIKIMELKDHLAEEVELHLHAEEYTKSLEQQIEKMKCCGNCKHCKYSESEESYEWCEKHDQIVNIAIKPCYAYEMFDLDKAIKEIKEK